VSERVESKELSDNKEYFLFLGLSIAIASLAMVALPYHKDIYALLTINFIVSFVGIVVFSFVLCGAWWIVCGRAPYERFFATYTYLTGPLILLTTMVVLISYGLLRLLDPTSFYALYEAGTGQAREQILSASSALAPFSISLVIGYLCVLLWGFVGWGAFRKINQVSKLRSFLAMILTGIFSLPVMALYYVFAAVFD
jgi:uncharacterized membrane protein